MDDTPHRRAAPMTAYGGPAPVSSVPLSRDEARAVFGQVMGLVALTLGFLACLATNGRRHAVTHAAMRRNSNQVRTSQTIAGRRCLSVIGACTPDPSKRLRKTTK